MKRFLSSLMVVMALSACQNDAPPPAPSEIDTIVGAFESDRGQSNQQFGVSAVKNNQQNISSTDCMVFERAAMQPMPQTLGGLSSYQESMRLRLLLGCASDTAQALTQYESSRRALQQKWLQTTQPLLESTRTLLRQTPMGELIEAQIQDMSNEHLACLSNTALQSRKRDRYYMSLDQATRFCTPDVVGLLYSQTQPICERAWQVTASHQQAQGPRDEGSMMAELTARYHLMFLACTPQATQEYVAFHQTLPPSILEGWGYRFRIPVDPILQCSLQESLTQERRKARSSQPARNYVDCGQKFELQRLYDNYQTPNIFTPEMLRGGLPYQWIFNPQRAQDDPKRWSLKECEKALIAQLHQRGINAVQPEALNDYCNSR